MLSGEEIFVTGVAGSFPNAENVLELFNNLRVKKDSLSEIDPFWKTLQRDAPPKIGMLKGKNQFDAGFFGIHYYQVETMRSSCRKLLEHAVEAILDSGTNPKDLVGTKTGVFIAESQIGIDGERLREKIYTPSFGVTGHLRSMYAQQLSYHLGLNGPAINCDAACSSSFYALEPAFAAIKSGKCDNAIVGGVHLVENANVHYGGFRMGVLDPKCENKIFDDDENGYVMSEAVVAIFIQKLKGARRVYSEILGVKTNCDGFKKEGLTHPSRMGMLTLLRDLYSEVNVDPATVSFIECHATGTRACSVEELAAIEDVFLPNRDKPLMIGSIKSTIGHTEASSGLCSLIKVLIQMENGCILPHSNCQNLRKDIECLNDGRVVVPDDCVTLNRDDDVLVGINNLGFGGTNSHVVVKYHKKSKFPVTSGGINGKRLICASARTSVSLTNILNSTQSQGSEEYLALLQNLFRYVILISTQNNVPLRKGIPGCPHRGFAIVENGKILKNSVQEMPLLLRFAEYCVDWLNIYDQIQSDPIISESVERMHTALLHQRVNLLEILNNYDRKLLASMAVQLAIATFLKAFAPNAISSSCGIISEISNSYFKNMLTVEEAILSAHHFLNATVKHEATDLKTKPTNFQHSVEIIDFGSNTILETLGILYKVGMTLDLDKLYPNKLWPIKPALCSPLINWNHGADWFVYKFKSISPHQKVVSISVEIDGWKYLAGHVVDGANLFPGAGFLYLVWTFYLESNHLLVDDVQVVLEDVKFLQPCLIPKEGTIKLTIQITKVAKRFELTEGDVLLASGKIYAQSIEREVFPLPAVTDDDSLTAKDIYQKLLLHSYKYENSFRGLEELNLAGTLGKSRWYNWITFLDHMAQMQLMRYESNYLYLPIKISRLVIDSQRHHDHLKTNTSIPICMPEFGNVMVAPGVLMENLMVTAVKKRPPKQACLEICKFIPYLAELSKEDSVLVHIQLVLENLRKELKVVEIVDNYSVEYNGIVSLMIETALDTHCNVDYFLTIYSSGNLSCQNLTVENKTVDELSNDTTLVVLAQASKRPQVITKILQKLPTVFILSREFADCADFREVDVVSAHDTDDERFVLLRKPANVDRVTVAVTNNNFDWLPKLQSVLKNGKALLLAQNEPTSGILGLVKCLRTEFYDIACVFLMDQDKKFNPQHDLYKEQLQKNLAMNVLKDGKWGSYRFLPLTRRLTKSEHAVAVVTKGNISSARWVQGGLSISHSNPHNEILIDVAYSGLNFNDVVSSSEGVRSKDLDNAYLGVEFAGQNSKGERFMGLTLKRGLTNMVFAKENCICKVPKIWSMEDAVTVPAVYSIVLYALEEVARLKQGQSVLIHSAAGGVGQAAINVASYYKCNIFATVGSLEKKLHLKMLYPFLRDCQIGNSRDTSFEVMINKQTGGKGVNVIINSLSGEKLEASTRCLAPRGILLEIGKYDMQRDSSIPLEIIRSSCRFAGINLDGFLDNQIIVQKKVFSLMTKGMEMGYVKPLPRTVYDMEQVKEAFEYMSQGIHTGKIVIRIRNQATLLEIEPKFYCHPQRVYIVLGGLGGFGLELIDWLIERGARYVVTVSRTSTLTSYQKLKIKAWHKAEAKILTVAADIRQQDECSRLLIDAKKLGEIDAIFVLSSVIRDGLFENLTKEMFFETFVPKAIITENLDIVSRKLCPNLRKFVTFSSFVTGKGNVGQTNYAMSNSIMERICEQRRRDGYPALAIEWGIIEDVGMATEKVIKDMMIIKLDAQSVHSCLKVLDILLNQDETIVSSFVVLDKVVQKSKQLDFLTTIADILGG
ncbi:hypothetical protein FQA39_LY16266 [Lamprigera yunnana]|nr:hypothetical protein FQA39_LY16266 [Lamprigera yunnana]